MGTNRDPEAPSFFGSESQLPSGGQFLADEEREITRAYKEGQGHFARDQRKNREFDPAQDRCAHDALAEGNAT